MYPSIKWIQSIQIKDNPIFNREILIMIIFLICNEPSAPIMIVLLKHIGTVSQVSKVADVPHRCLKEFIIGTISKFSATVYLPMVPNGMGFLSSQALCLLLITWPTHKGSTTVRDSCRKIEVTGTSTADPTYMFM